ncbi:MAG TPA: AI-2E family transporter [Terriglobales bacterium]|nr:AI-2E family transporter [Terriglobales bacterium]
MDRRRNDALWMLGIVLLLVLCYVLREPLLLIYVSVIFAVIFRPLVEKISHLRIGSWSPGPGVSILILIGAVLLGLGVFTALAVPPIISDANSLSHDLPKRVRQMTDYLRNIPLGDRIASELNAATLERYFSSILQSALKIFHGIAGGISVLITLIIMTAYFILDGTRAFQWSLELAPVEDVQRLRRTLVNAASRAQRWLGGQLLLMLILGTASTVTFGLLHIRYFYVLGVFAGIANFIPILGPIATVILASLVAVLDSWTKVLGVIIFYAVYQQVENSYLSPRIMRSTVGLPPIAVIVALLIGGELAGLLGAIVAVPTAAIIATVVHEYLIRPHEEEREGSEVRRIA